MRPEKVNWFDNGMEMLFFKNHQFTKWRLGGGGGGELSLELNSSTLNSFIYRKNTTNFLFLQHKGFIQVNTSRILPVVFAQLDHKESLWAGGAGDTARPRGALLSSRVHLPECQAGRPLESCYSCEAVQHVYSEYRRSGLPFCNYRNKNILSSFLAFLPSLLPLLGMAVGNINGTGNLTASRINVIKDTSCFKI